MSSTIKPASKRDMSSFMFDSLSEDVSLIRHAGDIVATLSRHEQGWQLRIECPLALRLLLVDMDREAASRLAVGVLLHRQRQNEQADLELQNWHSALDSTGRTPAVL